MKDNTSLCPGLCPRTRDKKTQDKTTQDKKTQHNTTQEITFGREAGLVRKFAGEHPFQINLPNLLLLGSGLGLLESRGGREWRDDTNKRSV
jgi:hypothetical protein